MISIIIPAYNEEDRIAATLHALLAQTERDVEIIVVDNGSTDRTTEIARQFPVQVLHEKRKGTMWSCECGRKQARGEIIVRLDADCIPPPDWLERGAAHFRNPRVVSVSGPYAYTDGGAAFESVSSFVQRWIYPLTNWWLNLTRSGGVMIGGNSFMRTSALAHIGGFDTSIVFYGDDTDIVKRLSVLGTTVFDRDLIVLSSARRFKNEGYLQTAGRYLKAFLCITVATKKLHGNKTDSTN
jgi:glycosyltransferase involved in cell wall biosynthesis